MSAAEIMAAAMKEIRDRRLSEHTEKAYLDWIYRFVTFHHTLPSEALTEKEISAFMSFHSVSKQIPSSTQNQALYAILFLYRNVLRLPVKHVDFIRLKKKPELPAVFTRDEIRRTLLQLSGEKKMIVSLLYGCGLTVNECLALRIQDIDLESQEITVTNYRTQKKRKLAIPYILKEEMSDRINKLRYRYMYLTLKDYRGVTLPGPVRMTAPESGKSFAWFYLFPAVKPLHTSADGSSLYHHRCATYVQKAVRKALKAAGIKKKASCHSFRHSYASHLLKDGRNISEVQKLLGHNNIRSTMLYMAILKFQSRVSDSPLDNL